MRHVLILLPLLACLALGVPTWADEDPAPDTKAAVEEALTTKVTVAFENVQFKRAVTYIAEVTRLNIVFPSNVEGTVTIEFKDAPAGKALKAIARAAGLEMKLTKAGVIRLYRAKKDANAIKVVNRKRVVDAEEARTKAWFAQITAELEKAEVEMVEARKRGDEYAVRKLAKHMEELRAKRKELLKDHEDQVRTDDPRKFEKAEQAQYKAWLAEITAAQAAAKAEMESARLRGDEQKARELEAHLEELEAKRKELTKDRKERIKGYKKLRKAAGEYYKPPQPPKPPVPPSPERAVRRYKEAAEKIKEAAEKRKRMEDRVAARKAEAKEMAKKARGMNMRAAEMRKLRRFDEAERYENEARVLMEKAKALESGLRLVDGEWVEFTYRTKAEPTEHAEARERLEHLRQALRALHAAGMHAEGERVEREIHELERRLHAHGHGEHGGDVMHALRALQHEVRSLRADVRALTALVKQLMAEKKARR